MKGYPERLKSEQKKTGCVDAVLAGTGFVKGRQAMLCCLDLTFMMGSMGSVVGEVVTRSIEGAMTRNLPLVIVSCSGGARMQESGLSLMQMAKTSAALGRFGDAGGIVHQRADGPDDRRRHRVVRNAGRHHLRRTQGPHRLRRPARHPADDPPGAPRGGSSARNTLKTSGMVDRVVHRHQLRSELARVIDYSGK